MEFDNSQDRDYYALKDPVHLGTVKQLVEIAEKIQVVDFTDGVF